jgi:probable phosphoglycerate mutase
VLSLGERGAIADAIVNVFVHATQPGATFLAGERFDAFHQRVATTLARLFDETEWSTLLVVAHGGVNRAILGEVLGAGLHAYGAIEQEPACINVVDVDAATAAPRRAFLRLLNHTPYDAGKTGTRRTTMEELLAAFAR